jgi:proteasome lid subunit RPN8/RPN11
MTGAEGQIRRREPLPMALAVLWGPAGGAAPQPLKQPYPIFLRQKPLRQLLAHTRTSPDKTLLGLLLGDVYECPQSGIAYVVVDQMLRVDLEVQGDKTAALMAQLWPRLQEKLKGQAARPVGWYHSHPTGGLVLSPDDIETQSKHFADPWQAVLLLATEGGKPIGGWFRATPDDGWKGTPLPFYEVLAPESIDSSGKKRSFVDWANYKGYKAVPASTPAAAAPPKQTVPTEAPAVGARSVGSPPTPKPAAPPPKQAPTPATPTKATPPKAAPPPPPPPREPVRAQAPPPPAPPPVVPVEPVELMEPNAMPPEEKKPAKRQSLTFILPDEVEAVPEPPRRAAPPPPPPPAASPPPRAPQAAPVPRASTPPAKAAEAPRKATRVLPLRHIITGVVGAVAMTALFVGAWALGLIQFGRDESAVATPVNAAAAEPAEPPPRPAAPAPQEQAAAQPPPTQAAPPPAAEPAPIRPAAPNPALIALDQLTDSVLGSVRSYRTRRTQFGQGQADCAVLAEALMAVEGHWINYNVQGKPRDLVLDATRAARDRSIYAEVDSVETHFDRSACPRP